MTDIFFPRHKRVLIFAMLCSILSFCFSACSDVDEPNIPNEITESRRTVLIYMAANNNLGSNNFDKADLNEIRSAISDGALGDDATLVVYHSRYGAAPVLTRLTSSTTDTIEVFDRNLPAVSATRMADVIALTRRHAPARDYGLVVWGHATGWLQDGIADDRLDYSFGPDGNTRMNVTTLASVLEDAGCFSYVYFDCCHMASVETVYELRNTCDFIIGSATELPAGGMDYKTNLPLLADGSRQALIESARNTFELYNAMGGSRRTCTMSVIATSGLDELASATRNLYRQAASSMPQGYEPQRFTDYDVTCRYFDFYDYVCNLTSPNSILETWKSAFGKTVLYSANTPYLWASVDLSRHHGLSTFIIKSATDLDEKGYKQLSWYEDVVTSLPIFPKLNVR